MNGFVSFVATMEDNCLTVCLIIFAIFLLICLTKAVIGPRVGDRVVCVNMMGTMVMVIVAVLAVKMNEGYLVDICLIYAMISFLAVVVLCKVYMGVYTEKKMKEASANKEKDINTGKASNHESLVEQYFDEIEGGTK